MYGDHSGVFICGSWGIKGCALSAVNNPGLELTNLPGSKSGALVRALTSQQCE